MKELKNEVTVITAPEITCEGCANSIKKALGKLDGVGEVAVEVATQKVTVEHGANVSREDIVSALDRAGYSAV